MRAWGLWHRGGHWSRSDGNRRRGGSDRLRFGLLFGQLLHPRQHFVVYGILGLEPAIQITFQGEVTRHQQEDKYGSEGELRELHGDRKRE